jgi:uncharacterized protein
MIGIVSRNAIVMPALALALLLSAVPAAFAASFDCGRAGSAVEKQICADPQLSALDGRLAVAYSTALKATDDYGKKALAKEQRNWIRYTRDICEDASCLQQAYTDRITVLSRNEKDIIDSGDGTVPDGRTIMRLRDPSIRIDAFNTSIAGDKRSGRIIGCSELIGLAPGVGANNITYAGICMLKDGAKRTQVEICGDEMVGTFQMQDRPAAPDLVGFAQECGG